MLFRELTEHFLTLVSENVAGLEHVELDWGQLELRND